MAATSRRDFLARCAAAPALRAAVFAGIRTIGANPLGLPIGSQTYPHRRRIAGGDFAGLCADMAALGIGAIELCSPGYGEFAALADAKQTRAIIQDHGLQCPSSHFSMRELRTRQQESIDWAKEIGMTQMGTASLGGRVQNGQVEMDAVKRAAEEYNRIGERAAQAGIQQFLHDEGFEVSHTEGRLTYEALLELLDPKLVKMQFQMSAMRQVGPPEGYFKKYPGRFISMHLQGVPAAPAAANEDVAVGKDGLDWRAIFEAAKTGGLRNYFIEMNWEATAQSVAYLKALKV